MHKEFCHNSVTHLLNYWLCSTRASCASLDSLAVGIQVLNPAAVRSVVSCQLPHCKLATNLTPTSLVELVAGSINNDALHATNSAQKRDDDSSKDTEPGCPEVPAAWARLLDGQPEHGGKAVGRGTKAQGTDEPQQVSKERDCHSCMHIALRVMTNTIKEAIMRGDQQMSRAENTCVHELCSNTDNE